MRYLLYSLVCILSLTSCEQKKKITSEAPSRQASAELTSLPDAEGWVELFDGKTTAGWRTYGKTTIGKSWVVKDGALTLEVVADGKRTRSKDGGDIITVGQYENYELSLEWKISPCGNSGIIFNVVEGKEYEKTYNTGPEMQVLDNTCHPDAKIHTHRAGDLYDLIACSEEVVKPVGEWNLAGIRIKDGATEFYLNGVKVVDFTMFNQEWADMIAKSKFKDMPGFGKFRKGHIALQDHGDAVAYRNIKIREL
ncbi:MAG: DUF1080 domain-containing protein [Saprospiraceae bacterium]|nr:DUF1080 domain-containing protein [Saprospiraceae bacterium]